jgi:PUA domain protein
MLPIQIVDKGAIKFILSGAHIMCPGLTSPGAFLDMECEEGAAVQVKKFQA